MGLTYMKKISDDIDTLFIDSIATPVVVKCENTDTAHMIVDTNIDIIKQDHILGLKEKDSIDNVGERLVLFLPSYKQYHVVFRTTYGSIVVEEVDLASFTGQSKNGDMKFLNTNIPTVQVKTESGNIYLEMAESCFNCESVLDCKNGRIFIQDKEVEIPEIKEQKNQVEIYSESGRIDILYLGQKATKVKHK